MANIALVNNWVPTIYQWADGDVLDGGPESLEVLPIKQLSNNSLHQRLVNVTDWNADLAAAYGYPLGAAVRHSGVSWRAVLANNVAPGTDSTKWERWGYSESELDAKLAALLPYGAPTACPNTGPNGAANKARLHKSALGEYWMWLGDAWRVVSGHLTSAATSTTSVSSGATVNVGTFTCHRPGLVAIHSHANITTTTTNQQLWLRLSLNGVVSASDVETAPSASQYVAASTSHLLRLLAGDVWVTSVTSISSASQNVNWGYGISYLD